MISESELIGHESNLTVDSVYQIKDTRLLWCDAKLFRADLLLQDAISESECADWLSNNCGVISKAQLDFGQNLRSPRLVNANVGDPRVAYRPPRYGRAAIVSLPHPCIDNQNLLLDIKGLGVPRNIVPKNSAHSTGVFHAPMAYIELIIQKIIEGIFFYHELDIKGVSSYALTYSDISADMPDLKGRLMTSRKMPCVNLVRAGHLRSAGNLELPLYNTEEEQLKLKIELFLRMHGITSASSSTRIRIDKDRSSFKIGFEMGRETIELPLDSPQIPKYLLESAIEFPLVLDGMNVQSTRDLCCDSSRARLVDFGQYRIKDRFELPLLSLVRDRSLNWGRVIGSTSKDWVAEPSIGDLPNRMSVKKELSSETVRQFGLNFGAVYDPIVHLAYELSYQSIFGEMPPEVVSESLDDFVESMIF